MSLTRSKEFSAQTTCLYFVLFYAATSLAQIVSGPLSDRFGYRRFAMAGLAAAAAGVFLLAPTPGLWVFLPLALSSLGLGCLGVAAMAALTVTANENERGAVSGLYYLFWGAGYVLGPVSLSFGTTPHFELLASCLLIYSVLLWRVNE